MPDHDHNRHSGITAVAVLALLLVFSLIGHQFGFKQGVESHQSYSTESYLDDSARTIAEECNLLADSSAKTNCIAEALATSTTLQMAQEGLDAQQQISRWTLATWIVSLGTTIVACYVARLTYLTLMYTRKMAAETSRIGDNQIRPWLSIADFEIASFEPPRNSQGDICAGNGHLDFRFKVTNHGNSPANNVKIIANRAIFMFANSGEHTCVDEPVSNTVEQLFSDSWNTGRPKLPFAPGHHELARDWSFIKVYDREDCPRNAYYPAIVVCISYSYGAGENTTTGRTWVAVQLACEVTDQDTESDFRSFTLIHADHLSAGRNLLTRRIGGEMS